MTDVDWQNAYERFLSGEPLRRTGSCRDCRLRGWVCQGGPGGLCKVTGMSFRDIYYIEHGSWEAFNMFNGW